MNKDALKQKMSESFVNAIGFATLRACWTAAAIIVLGALFTGDGSPEFVSPEFVTTMMIVGSIVSLFVAKIHSFFVLGFLTMMYRPKIQSDTAGMLFGRWWLIHSFTVWLIPAILMVISQVDEFEAWGSLIAVGFNSSLVLWLFCRRYIEKRDKAIVELKKMDKDAAISGLVPS
ncbi:MAG: hypothetical protein AAF927_19160 [Bacteroidota bacterium]